MSPLRKRCWNNCKTPFRVTPNPADAGPPEGTEVLVIGGGIQGAGIAQASAAAGFTTTLVEKTGWASGTSSKSSKLIHGGLRYLDQLQLGLVYESLRERDILCRVAPGLVRLNRFFIPVYRDSTIRPWKLFLGLSLYALLGRLGKSKRFSLVPRRGWGTLDGLDTRGLQAVFRYFDGQTDDARLTRAVIESARELGASILCPAELTAATASDDGYAVSLDRGGAATTLRARLIVNATGPWSNEVAARITPQPVQPSYALVQGSHLVLNRRLSDCCYYLEAPADGRAVFVLPWRNTTLVGTTETPYAGDPAGAACTPGEEQYLLDTVRHYFPDYGRDIEVTERMAGLRVLPGNGGDVHGRSRDVMVTHSGDGKHAYINVCGGKLTGYRANAANVTALIRRYLGDRRPVADTARLPLPATDTG